MLGLDNPVHLLFLLAILLLVFGAKRLPEMGRSLGAGLRGFKESINGEAGPAPVEQLPAASAPVPAAATDRATESAPARPAA
jgi:sec-independent protein translocase protein TatA